MTKAPELLPCPFCGGECEIVDAVEAGEQAKVVCCRKCMASSRVIFALMDDVTFDLVSAWNARTDHALALVAADRGEVLDAIDAFNTLPPDENGHCWRESDLLDQEVMKLRARTPDDATAALERVKQDVRNEALREAVSYLKASFVGGDAIAEAIEALITEGQSDGE